MKILIYESSALALLFFIAGNSDYMEKIIQEGKCFYTSKPVVLQNDSKMYFTTNFIKIYALDDNSGSKEDV